jgi:hypothetical protein
MRKSQPGGDRVLCVESLGWAGGELGVDQAVDGLRVSYSLESDNDLQLLDQVQWADWDHGGRRLVATRAGKLQAWTLCGSDFQSIVRRRPFASRTEPDPRAGVGPAMVRPCDTALKAMISASVE